MLRSRTVRTLLCLGLLLGVAPVAMLPPAQARPQLPAPKGQDPINPGQAYAGDFPDPWIMRLGSKYFAYSTTSGPQGEPVNLPTMTSTDLHTWIARPATADAPAGDGLPHVATWATKTTLPDGRTRPGQGPWAPSVTKIGKNNFVLAYAAQVASAPGTLMCISLAHAPNPTGPFTDTTTQPTLCPTRGAIDPQVFVAPNGRPWLVWKRDLYPAKLWTQPMDLAATGVLPGKSAQYLAKVNQSWEGSIIENPAMIRFQKRYYVFYSANSYATTRYAIGYLICKSWKGDCHKPRKKPLLATQGAIAGPGGPAPFIDTRGRLRLGYHAWNAGQVGYNTVDCQLLAPTCGQRRLHVAKLKVVKGGKLKVVQPY
ncbi:beta-xylosidase [Marmoricola sp. URHA0025 HA25]